MELENAKNEVLRKIGRNVLLFQQLEHMLKFLNANMGISGFSSEIQEKQDKQTATVIKQTMGLSVGHFFEHIYCLGEKSTIEAPEEVEEPYLSFTFSVECSDAAKYEATKQVLASLVADRNKLIHHLIPHFNPKSIESCVETDRYLEEQREKILPVFKMLKDMVNHHVELRAKVAEYLHSDEGKKLFEVPGLRHSHLVILLADISMQMARPDGWTLLNVAGELIRKHAPEERACLKDKYGHKTLKELIVAAELFEIFEEPTDKGGIRVLYRLKPDWELQNLEE